MLECPELKQVRVCLSSVMIGIAVLITTGHVLQYDLRVVFLHDGLYGRKHLYSYVRDRNKWWKIADTTIERVRDTRLTAAPPSLP